MRGLIYLWLLLVISLALMTAGLFLFWASHNPLAVIPILFFGACAGITCVRLQEGREQNGDHSPELEGITFDRAERRKR